MSKEIARTVGGKRITWLALIVAVFVLAIVVTRAQSAHATTLTNPTATSQTALVSDDIAIPQSQQTESVYGVEHPALNGLLLQPLSASSKALKWLILGVANAPYSAFGGNPWATMNEGVDRSSVLSSTATAAVMSARGIDEKILASQVLAASVDELVPRWGAAVQTTGAKTQYAQVGYGFIRVTADVNDSSSAVNSGGNVNQSGSQQLQESSDANSGFSQFLSVLVVVLMVVVFAVHPATRRHFGNTPSGPSGHGSSPLIQKWRISKRFGAPMRRHNSA